MRVCGLRNKSPLPLTMPFSIHMVRYGFFALVLFDWTEKTKPCSLILSEETSIGRFVHTRFPLNSDCLGMEPILEPVFLPFPHTSTLLDRKRVFNCWIDKFSHRDVLGQL